MLTPTQIAAYHENGYLKLEGFFGDLKESRERAKVLEERAGIQKNVFIRWDADGRKTLVKIHQLASSEPIFGALAFDPRLMEVARDLASMTSVFRDVLVAKPPKSGGKVHYHQDAAYWNVATPDRVLSAWIALDDASEASGCLQVVPGSHRAMARHDVYFGKGKLPSWATDALRGAVSLTGTGDNPKSSVQKFFASLKSFVLGAATRWLPALNDLNELRIDPTSIPSERVVILPAKVGDVILFHSRLFHASGPNSGAHERRAYIVTYAG